jgi:hypothetical protein
MRPEVRMQALQKKIMMLFLKEYSKISMKLYIKSKMKPVHLNNNNY